MVFLCLPWPAGSEAAKTEKLKFAFMMFDEDVASTFLNLGGAMIRKNTIRMVNMALKKPILSYTKVHMDCRC